MTAASWAPGPQDPPWPGEEVHVWGARLDLDDAALARMEVVLAPDERLRANRFHRERDRRRFVAAHGILRALLGGYLERDPASVAFIHGARGKPALDPSMEPPASPAASLDKPGRLHFNISHSGTIAAIAVAAGREVGVDLESPDRALRNDSIVARYFPPEEAARLHTMPHEDRAAAFLRSWVCKEAFAKALGLGLAALDVRTIQLMTAGGAVRLEGTTEAARELIHGWALQELPPLEGCPGAVVSAGGNRELRLWRWTGD